MTTEPIQDSFQPSLLEFVGSLPDLHLLASDSLTILREMNREDISNKELASLVQKNPVLVSRVLQVSNSAYFGVTRRIATVNQAVTMLGVYQVKAIVHGIVLEGYTAERGGVAKVIGSRLFSAHSLALAYLAGRLARLFKFQIVGVGEAETAGLLHDIGLCLLGVGDRSKYEGIQRTFWNRMEKSIHDGDPFDPIEIERETLGFTHADLGAWLASEWNLPPVIQYAVRSHHGDIENCLNKEMATVLHIAEFLSNLHGLDYLPVGSCETIHPSVIGFLEQQGRIAVFEDLESQLAEDIERARSLFELALHDGEGEISGAAARDIEANLKTVHETSGETVVPGGAPGWSLVVPGLPQMLSGSTTLGIILLALFGTLAAGGAVSLQGGNSALGLGMLGAAAVAWVVSILRA